MSQRSRTSHTRLHPWVHFVGAPRQYRAAGKALEMRLSSDRNVHSHSPVVQSARIASASTFGPQPELHPNVSPLWCGFMVVGSLAGPDPGLNLTAPLWLVEASAWLRSITDWGRWGSSPTRHSQASPLGRSLGITDCSTKSPHCSGSR